MSIILPTNDPSQRISVLFEGHAFEVCGHTSLVKHHWNSLSMRHENLVDSWQGNCFVGLEPFEKFDLMEKLAPINGLCQTPHESNISWTLCKSMPVKLTNSNGLGKIGF